MGKSRSKSDEKKSEQLPRTGDVTPAMLRDYASQLESLAGQFTAIAKEMESLKPAVSAVKIDGFQKFSRGKKIVRQFFRNVEYVFKEAIDARE